MSQPLLSILIPSTPDRISELETLLDAVQKQYALRYVAIGDIGNATIDRFYDLLSPIEIVIITDNKEMTIGEKREKLYHYAIAPYSWQIDSDDMISKNSIRLILKAIEQNPDCITFRENCMMNGKYYSSNHSLKYDDWADNFDGFDFVRTPFYKDVIKTEIARSVPFEHIRYAEDHAWARALKPRLRNEIHIDQELYFYIHNSKPEDHNERYGIV